MGEMGEVWREVRAARKEENRKRWDDALLALDAAGLSYCTPTAGCITVSQNPDVVDFWPSSGKWRLRGATRNLHGLNELVHWFKSRASSGRRGTRY